nr:unnamed protein product [Fasciola hepatica]
MLSSHFIQVPRDPRTIFAVRSHSKLIQAHKRPSRLLHSCRLCVSVVYNSIWSFRRRPSLPRRIGQLYSLEEILG